MSPPPITPDDKEYLKNLLSRLLGVEADLNGLSPEVRAFLKPAMKNVLEPFWAAFRPLHTPRAR